VNAPAGDEFRRASGSKERETIRPAGGGRHKRRQIR
jgi:hypothetical protein